SIVEFFRTNRRRIGTRAALESRASQAEGDIAHMQRERRGRLRGGSDFDPQRFIENGWICRRMRDWQIGQFLFSVRFTIVSNGLVHKRHGGDLFSKTVGSVA